MVKFDKNAHALEDGVVTVYGYDPDSCVYTKFSSIKLVIGVGIPANTTLLAPPEMQDGQAVVFRVTKNQWETVPDYRGQTVWSKADGAQSVIYRVGSLPDSVTVMQPSEPLMKWDAPAGGWVPDYAARATALKMQAKSALTTAKRYVSENYTMLNEPTPQNWVDYLKALMAIASGKDTANTALPVAPQG